MSQGQRYRADVIGGHDGATWHGVIDSVGDAYADKAEARRQAEAAGWVPSRHYEVYLTLEQ